MKHLLAILSILTPLAVVTPLAAMAQTPAPLGPNNGAFGDWTAATYGTGGTKICYAFTKPKSTSPALPNRGLAMLTVTQRPGASIEISFTPGFTYRADAGVNLLVGHDNFPMYIQDNVAVTDSVPQTLAMFARESATAIISTGPDGIKYTDLFSLTGFSAANRAITDACP